MYLQLSFSKRLLSYNGLHSLRHRPLSTKLSGRGRGAWPHHHPGFEQSAVPGLALPLDFAIKHALPCRFPRTTSGVSHSPLNGPTTQRAATFYLLSSVVLRDLTSTSSHYTMSSTEETFLACESFCLLLSCLRTLHKALAQAPQTFKLTTNHKTRTAQHLARWPMEHLFSTLLVLEI